MKLEISCGDSARVFEDYSGPVPRVDDPVEFEDQNDAMCRGVAVSIRWSFSKYTWQQCRVILSPEVRKVEPDLQALDATSAADKPMMHYIMRYSELATHPLWATDDFNARVELLEISDELSQIKVCPIYEGTVPVETVNLIRGFFETRTEVTLDQVEKLGLERIVEDRK